ncbi:MAG: hypothetical protein MR868_01505, partial [Lachnospiraceae bacterium]|nr:hypothetical protein [Lachnospiraceae bacterium]
QSMQELIGVLYEGAKIRKASSGKGPDHNGKKGLYIGVGAVSAVVLAGVLLMAGGTKESLDPEAARKAAIESTEIGDPEENSIINPTRETGSGSTEAAEEMVIVDTDVQEDELGEQIVFYHPQDSIDATGTTLFLCKPDGTVEVKGSNASGQFEAKDWTGVVSVKTGYYHTLGLRQDGTVLVTTPAGRDYGQYDVDHWTNIVDIAAGPLLSIGVTADGNVLAAGNGNSDKIDLNHLREWTDIRQIACSHGRFDCIAGLRTDGTVVFEGEFDADIHGWEKVENIFFNYGILVGMEADGTVHVEALADDPEILEWANTMKNLPKMKQIISHTVGITADGTVLLPYLSDTEREVTGWTDMVGISRWNSGFCGIRSDSTIVYDYPNSGNAELEDFTNLEWVRLTDNVNFGSYTGIMGQTKDGTILYCGANNLYMGWIDELGESAEIADVEERMLVLQDGTMYTGGYEDVLPHSNVKEAIYSSDGCILLMQDGTVDAYGLYGGVHQCEEDVKAWTGIQQICGDDEWVCGLKADGTVEMTGDLASDETDIKSIFASKSVCLGIRGDGTVAVLKASNRDEQSGLLQAEQWTDMVQLALSESHIIGLKNDGTVVAAGDNNNGECDIEEWADVVSVDAADGCTIGLTKDGKLLMAGSLY